MGQCAAQGAVKAIGTQRIKAEQALSMAKHAPQGNGGLGWVIHVVPAGFLFTQTIASVDALGQASGLWFVI